MCMVQRMTESTTGIKRNLCNSIEIDRRIWQVTIGVARSRTVGLFALCEQNHNCLRGKRNSDGDRPVSQGSTAKQVSERLRLEFFIAPSCAVVPLYAHRDWIDFNDL